jgi:hypothetical protein
MKSLNNINDIFGVDTEVSIPKEQLPNIQYSASEVEQDDDFQAARNTLRNLLTKNEDVLTDLIYISKNSEHPRAFEVVGKLIEAQTNVAKELMGLHKQKKDIEKAAGKIPTTQNNILFAGSTSDLMKLINGEKNKIIDVK